MIKISREGNNIIFKSETKEVRIPLGEANKLLENDQKITDFFKLKFAVTVKTVKSLQGIKKIIQNLMKKFYKPTTFYIQKELYLHVKRHVDRERNIVQTEPIYKLYVANLGKGNPPFLILTNHIKNFKLGENRAVLMKLPKQEIDNYFKKHGFPNLQMYSEYIKEVKNWFESQGFLNTQKYEDALRQYATKYVGSEIYKITLPLSDEYLQWLIDNPNELKKETNLYLYEKCKKDAKFIIWAKSRLVIVSDELSDHWIAQYRSHAFVVKNPKVGFSRYGQKVGRCVGRTTIASISGWVDAKGNVHYGAGHGNFRSLVLDEANRYQEVVSDFHQTFTEQGKQENDSAAYTFANLGAPTVSTISNAGEETATPTDMLYAIDSILPRITTVPEALGSRMGLIICSYKLLRALKLKFVSQEEIFRNQLIIDSLFEAAAPKVKLLYRNVKIQMWLEQQLEDYKQQILSLVNGFLDPFFGKRCKLFWIDHAEGAYRHVRGVALELAIVHKLGEILKRDVDDALVNEIIKKAEEELQTVISINLDSLKVMIEITKDVEPLIKKMFALRYENLKPSYVKALVFAYTHALVKNPQMNPKQFLNLNNLSASYNSIETEKLQNMFGPKYSLGFSTILQALNKLSSEGKKDVTALLETRFNIDLRYFNKEWSIRSVGNEIDYLKKYMETSIYVQSHILDG